MDEVYLDALKAWLPKVHSNNSILDDQIGINSLDIIKINMYEGTGLIIPKCGRNPFLSGLNIKLSLGEDSNINCESPKLDKCEDDYLNLDGLSDDMIIEEIIVSLCQFMTHHHDNIYPSIIDYKRLYNRAKVKRLCNMYMLPDVKLLEEIRGYKFPLPQLLQQDIEVIEKRSLDYESQTHNLAIVNNLIFNLWITFTKSTGTLSGGYIPDYITQMGWNTKLQQDSCTSKESITLALPIRGISDSTSIVEDRSHLKSSNLQKRQLCEKHFTSLKFLAIKELLDPTKVTNISESPIINELSDSTNINNIPESPRIKELCSKNISNIPESPRIKQLFGTIIQNDALSSHTSKQKSNGKVPESPRIKQLFGPIKSPIASGTEINARGIPQSPRIKELFG